MKKIMHWALLLAFSVLAANCGATREHIRTQSITWCGGIFCEVDTPDGPPPGFADRGPQGFPQNPFVWRRDLVRV